MTVLLSTPGLFRLAATRWVLLASLANCFLPAAQSYARSFYRLESTVTLPAADPRWDYLVFDRTRSYLFISRRKDGVTVYDTKTKKIVGTIENSAGANATTLVPEYDRGFTTNGDGSTTIFALSSLKTIERKSLGSDADAAYYEPATKQLAFMMGDSKLITFVDAKTGAPTGSLKMNSEKIEAAAADGAGNLYVAERDRNMVARIDGKTRQLTAEWNMTGCQQPTGMAIDREGRRLFVGCRGQNPVLAVIDFSSGKVIASPVIGRGNDGVVYDPDTRRIFTSNGGDANLVIFDQMTPDSYKLSEAPTTRPQARTMALDPQSKKVFLVTAEGTVNPMGAINVGGPPFYPNKYFDDSFTLLTYSPR